MEPGLVDHQPYEPGFKRAFSFSGWFGCARHGVWVPSLIIILSSQHFAANFSVLLLLKRPLSVNACQIELITTIPRMRCNPGPLEPLSSHENLTVQPLDLIKFVIISKPPSMRHTLTTQNPIFAMHGPSELHHPSLGLLAVSSVLSAKAGLGKAGPPTGRCTGE